MAWTVGLLAAPGVSPRHSSQLVRSGLKPLAKLCQVSAIVVG